MDNETLEGYAEATASKPGSYGIKIDGEWYNLSRYADEEQKEKQRTIENDQFVKLDLDQPESGFYESIISVGDEPDEAESNDVMEDGESDEGDTSQQSAPKQDSGDKPSSNSSYNERKDDRIAKKVAFKEAAETVRDIQPSDQDIPEDVEDIDTGLHMKTVSKVANGYYNILKSMGEDQ